MIPVCSVKFVISGIASIAPAMGVNRITPTETAAREMLRQFVVAR
jgi:hypothetical protein